MKVRITKPPVPTRAAHGQWTTHAATVVKLVAKGWCVMDAVRHVVAELELVPVDKAVVGIRSAYYQKRGKA